MSREEGLAEALKRFDRVEANLVKLERVWSQLVESYPDGIVFGLDSPATAALLDDFRRLTSALPPIDGYRVEVEPMSPDGVARSRLEVAELGEPTAEIDLERGIEKPGRQIGLYRRRLEGARRRLVRDQVMKVTNAIDAVVRDIDAQDGLGQWRDADRWGELQDLVSELERLVGDTVPRRARWSDLHRHLHFAESNDLSDIATMDWPSVRAELEVSLYDDHEPLPVEMDDLGDLVRARPSGPVSTKLDWARLSHEDFEGLVFALFQQTEGYENPNWLMRTNAQDRGRDLEVHRVITDPLSGVMRQRVIVQCKHWLTKSVPLTELSACVETVTLWEPPPVDVLIVATSGRFTQDAVSWREKRTQDRTVPAVDLWPENHLELLLARRPHIAPSFGLR